MKNKGEFLILVIVILAWNFQIFGQIETVVDNNGNAISEKEQNKLLSARLDKSPITGTFNSFGSFLFAFNDLAIHTDHKEIAGIKLGSPFPSFYKPTWKEVFDSVATQTHSKWKYDANRNYWVFSPTNDFSSYDVTLADGWTSRNKGIFVSYAPPNFPVGMDVYQLGSYSAESPQKEEALFEKIREDLALRFAKGFDPNVKAKNMQVFRVADSDALYFEAIPPKRKELIWRQWAFVKNGKAFVIVSTLNKDDSRLFGKVQSMVKSFRVK